MSSWGLKSVEGGIVHFSAGAKSSKGDGVDLRVLYLQSNKATGLITQCWISKANSLNARS